MLFVTVYLKEDQIWDNPLGLGCYCICSALEDKSTAEDCILPEVASYLNLASFFFSFFFFSFLLHFIETDTPVKPRAM